MPYKQISTLILYRAIFYLTFCFSCYSNILEDVLVIFKYILFKLLNWGVKPEKAIFLFEPFLTEKS